MKLRTGHCLAQKVKDIVGKYHELPDTPSPLPCRARPELRHSRRLLCSALSSWLSDWLN